MQHELTITVFDLRVILRDLIGKDHLISIKLAQQADPLEFCAVKVFDLLSDKLMVWKSGNGQAPLEISLVDIESIEFRTFYRYKGEASKIFSVR